jgi:hypothetical protein
MPKKTKAKKLTPLQIFFLDDLYAHPDEAQGTVYARHYRATGKAAAAAASRLLRREEAKLYLAAKAEATAERNHITEDEIVQRLWQLADFDISKILNDVGDLRPWDEIPEAERRAIASITPMQGGMFKLTFVNRESCLARTAEMLGFGAKNKAKADESSVLRDLFNFVQKNSDTGKPGTLKFDLSLAARSQFDSE